MACFKYIKLLIKANSGESSKGFLLVTVTLASLMLLGVCGFSLVLDVISNGHILTDLIGMAAFVGSISTLLGAVGLTKVYGDKVDTQTYIQMKNDNNSANNITDMDDLIVSDDKPSAKISEKEANEIT